MVAFVFLDRLRNICPFSIFESISELRESEELVRRLSVPESTKNFVFAIRVPEHDSTIYLLSAQNLSQRSAIDAECLIREVRPDAVVAQLNNSGFGEAQVEESVLLGDGSTDSIPTSAFKVVKQCFVDEVKEEDYETIAGILVLREIFGTSVNGHLLAAKRVAGEVGSSFMVLESPFVMQGLAKCLMAQNYASTYFSRSTRFLIANYAHAHMLKLLPSHITQLSKELNPSSCLASGVSSEILSDTDGVPRFAESIYSLLIHLHDIFNGQPCIRKALASARKMMSDVNRGEPMDAEVISDVFFFQIAVEGVRIGLNNAGRRWSSRTQVQFPQLSSEDKAYALMADHLRSQAKKFKKIVAVVDASNLAGLRRLWRSCVPQEVKDMSEDFDKDENSNDSKLKRLLSDNKPVGAGAKAISASPFFKILTLKAPAPSNLFLTQSTHKAMSFAFTKVAYPSQEMAPVFASSGAKSTSLLQAYIIGAVKQSIISSAEKTIFSAMRTAFYEIMRKRRAKPMRFGASLATCAGLILYGDGIECAAVSLPSAPSIAKLGRGIQNLRKASLEVRSRENNRIQIAIESLGQRLKNFSLH